VVCAKPIDEKRLDAVPWTPYCLEHAQQFEPARVLRTPTL
jgi:RNA polymerase-binding transcription factor DksA